MWIILNSLSANEKLYKLFFGTCNIDDIVGTKWMIPIRKKIMKLI